MSFLTRKPAKVFYEYNAQTQIGPTGDFVEAGVYWTFKSHLTLSVQANKVWFQFANGLLEQVKPVGRVTLPTEADLTWLELKSKHLQWFD